jgi:hypothetical protein
MHSFDVRIWGIRRRNSKAAPFQLRWLVNDMPFQEPFQTKTLAEARRSQLMSKARSGEAFDCETGLPVSEVRMLNRTTWFEHAVSHVDMKWSGASAKHRASIAESLTIVTMALCSAEKGRPEAEVLRRSLYLWAFNGGRRALEPPEEESAALAWLRKNAPAMADLDMPKRWRPALEALALRKDGKPAAANTIKRRRAVLTNCLRLAVEKDLLAGNPLHRMHWQIPRAVEELDERSVAA